MTIEATEAVPKRTPLFDAIRTWDIDAIDAALRSGADINAPVRDTSAQSMVGYTPLMFASIVGNPQIARAILARGADVNGRGKNGYTALVIATGLASIAAPSLESGESALYEQALDVAQILLDAGADIEAETDGGVRALDLAAARSNPRAVRWLVERGARIEQDQTSDESESGCLRLHRDNGATLVDNPDVRPWDETLAVLEELAATHGTPRPRPDPLAQAIREGDLNAIESLITGGRDVNAFLVNDGSVLPITLAAACGNPDATAKLVALGADPNRHILDGVALHYAVMRASSDNRHERALETAQVLLDAGARIDEVRAGTTLRALHYAVGHSNVRAVRLLVERGARIAKDQAAPDSESSFLRKRQAWYVLQDNPDVRPWDETLALLEELAATHGT